MLFYVALYILIASCAFVIEFGKDKKVNTYLTIVCIAILSFVAGFRYHLGGYDYDNYEYFYDYLQEPAEIIIGRYEIGYSALVYFLKNICGLSFNGYLVVESILFFTFLYLGLKKYVNHWGIFLMFFLYKMFFYQTFISMRQSITVVLFFIAWRYIEEGKPLKYYLFTTLAIIPFHNGAILLLILYPLIKIKLRKRVFLLFGLAFMSSLFIAPIVGNLFNQFSTGFIPEQISQKVELYGDSKNSLSLLYVFEYYLLFFLVYLYFDKIIHLKHGEFIISLFLITAPFVTIFRNSDVLVRELPYFYPTYAIVIGYFITLSKKNRYWIFLFTFLICFGGFLKFVIQFDDGAMMPYHTWLSVPDVYFFNH